VCCWPAATAIRSIDADNDPAISIYPADDQTRFEVTFSNSRSETCYNYGWADPAVIGLVVIDIVLALTATMVFWDLVPKVGAMSGECFKRARPRSPPGGSSTMGGASNGLPVSMTGLSSVPGSQYSQKHMAPGTGGVQLPMDRSQDGSFHAASAPRGYGSHGPPAPYNPQQQGYGAGSAQP
jgi:hypothetical protein